MFKQKNISVKHLLSRLLFQMLIKNFMLREKIIKLQAQILSDSKIMRKYGDIYESQKVKQLYFDIKKLWESAETIKNHQQETISQTKQIILIIIKKFMPFGKFTKQAIKKSLTNIVDDALQIQQMRNNTSHGSSSNSINEFLLRDIYQNAHTKRCICCDKNQHSQSQICEFIPLISLQRIQNIKQPKKQKYMQKIARLLVCLLNENGGCIIFGQIFQPKDQHHKQSTQQIIQIGKNINLNQATLFNNYQINQKKNIVSEFFKRIQRYIGNQGDFKVFIEEIQFKKHKCKELPANKKKGWAIRLKIIPTNPGILFYFSRKILANKYENNFLVRNSKLQICQILEDNIYECLKQKYMKTKSKKQSITNHIDYQITKQIIRNYQKYDPIMKKPVLDLKNLMKYSKCLIITHPIAKLRNLQCLKLQLKDYNIPFVQCQLYPYLCEQSTLKYHFFNIDIDLRDFQYLMYKVGILQKDVAILKKDFVVQIPEDKADNKKLSIPKSLENLESLIEEHLQYHQFQYAFIGNNKNQKLLLKFDNMEQAAFAYVFYKKLKTYDISFL